MLDLFFSVAMDALIAFDESGRVIRANQFAAEMFGYSMDEFQTMTVENLLPKKNAKNRKDLVLLLLNTNVENRKIVKSHRVWVLHKSGYEFLVMASIGKGSLNDQPVSLISLRDSLIDGQEENLTDLPITDARENPNAEIRIGRDGRILFANKSGKRLLRRSGMVVTGQVPSEWVGFFEQALKRKTHIQRVIQHGRRLYSCHFNPTPEMGYVTLYALDITEYEAEKNRLALSDEILRSIGNLVLVANSNAEVVYISPSVKEILGYEPEELIGNGWWELERISGGDVMAERDYISKAAAGLRQVDDKPYEHRVRHKNGDWRWLMLADRKGPRDLLIGIGTDVTESKKTGGELQNQRDFAQTLTTQMGQGLTVIDEEGHFTFANPYSAKILGYETEQLAGLTAFDVTFPEDHELVKTVLSKRNVGEVTTLEIRLRGRNGDEVYALVTSVPHVVDGQFAGTINVITDLTERRHMENLLRDYATAIEKSNIDLADARDRALEASYLKSSFLATMSHEIRTPMNAIMGMTEMLLSTDLNDEQREFAQTIDSSTQGLLAILNDILDFSKIEAGKLSIIPSVFNPVEMTRDLIKLFQPRAQEKNITLSMMATASIPETLVGDGGRIRQILGNFVSNAIKFTEKNGCVFINISGTSINQNTLMTTFTVQDNGIGVSDMMRSKLFEPFTQADGSNTRKHGGTGLGLAISRRLVDLMHGEIGFESFEGTGSTFWFSLPLYTTAPKDQEETEFSSRGMQKKYLNYSSRKPILIVEDNLVNRDLFTLQLQEFDLTIKQAGNGREAVELLQIHPDDFSLVLMDVHMPEMDGFTATRLIRKSEAGTGRHIPIVAITADAMVSSKKLCLEAGMDDFLTKPVTLANLDKLFRKWFITEPV
ncbi:MAG TPA: PAS domain S-box protein [Anaerolineales bacterium]|nr:PAS domain S-box protein [Anaerolineales bacterium]